MEFNMDTSYLMLYYKVQYGHKNKKLGYRRETAHQLPT